MILTVDGRTFCGSLIACDQVTNITLEDAIERIVRPQDDTEPSREEPRGIWMVRGDNIVLCGLVDEEIDDKINWEKVHGEVISSTKHI